MSDGTYYWQAYGPDRGQLPDGEGDIRFDSGWERGTKPPKDMQSVFVHNYLSAGDYSGGNDGGIVRSNVNAFRESISDDYLGQLFWEIIGSHGYFGIAVRSDVLDEDSALYAAGDESLIDAANSIREIIDALDAYPILDESGHSELESNQQAEQFPDAASDVYVSEHTTTALYALVESVSGVEVRHGRTSFAGLIAVVFGDDLPKEARDRLIADWGEHVSGLQSFYYGLAELFSIYPETEGSGDNIAILFRFDQFADRLLDAVQALRGPVAAPLIPGAVPILGSMIIDGIFADAHQAFDYNSKVYNMVRTGRDISHIRNPTAYPILADAIQANTGRAIILGFEGKLIETAKQGPLAGRR